MRLALLLLLFCPVCLSAQTWERAWQGAQKAMFRPGKSWEYTRDAVYLKRKQLLSSTQGNLNRWLLKKYTPVVPLLQGNTAGWAALSNRLLVKEFPRRKAQMQFFSQQQHVPQGLLEVQTGKTPALADRIGAQTEYVLFGGKRGEVQGKALFKKLVSQYKAAFPDRQIIVLSETLPDRGVRFASEFAASEKEKSFVRSFVRDGFLVAGIGDSSAQKGGFLRQEETQLILPAADVPAGLAARSWHMRRQLTAWRQSYPQAVFFLYISPAAASYDWRFSLANNLPAGKVFSISLTSVKNSRDFLFHRWNSFRYVRPSTLVWHDDQWARMSGFDAQIILP